MGHAILRQLRQRLAHSNALVELLEKIVSPDGYGEPIEAVCVGPLVIVVVAALDEHRGDEAVVSATLRFLILLGGKPGHREAIVDSRALMERLVEVYETFSKRPGYAWGFEFWGVITNITAGVPYQKRINFAKTPGFLKVLRHAVEVQSADRGCARRMAAAIRNLMEGNEVAEELLRMEETKGLCVGLVRCLIRHREVSCIVDIMCGAMVNIAWAPAAKARFVALGPYVFSVLFLILAEHVENPEVIKQVASLVSNLCRDTSARESRKNIAAMDRECRNFISKITKATAPAACDPTNFLTEIPRKPLLKPEEMLAVEPKDFELLIGDMVWSWRLLGQPDVSCSLDSVIAHAMTTLSMDAAKVATYEQSMDVALALTGCLRNIYGGTTSDVFYFGVEPAANIKPVLTSTLNSLSDTQLKPPVKDEKPLTTRRRMYMIEGLLAAMRNYIAASSVFRKQIIADGRVQEAVTRAVHAQRESVEVATQGCWVVYDCVRLQSWIPTEGWKMMTFDIWEKWGDKEHGRVAELAEKTCSMVKTLAEKRAAELKAKVAAEKSAG